MQIPQIDITSAFLPRQRCCACLNCSCCTHLAAQRDAKDEASQVSAAGKSLRPMYGLAHFGHQSFHRCRRVGSMTWPVPGILLLKSIQLEQTLDIRSLYNGASKGRIQWLSIAIQRLNVNSQRLNVNSEQQADSFSETTRCLEKTFLTLSSRSQSESLPV